MKAKWSCVVVLALAVGMPWALPGASAAETTESKPARIEVRVCPIMMEPVEGEGAGYLDDGRYRIWFSCKGCKSYWPRLDRATRDKKIAAALKKQEELKDQK